MVFSLVLGFNHTFWVVASFKPHTLNSQALMIKKKQQKTYLLLKGVPTRFDDIMKGTLFVSSERSMNTLCTLVSGNTYKTSYLYFNVFVTDHLCKPALHPAHTQNSRNHCQGDWTTIHLFFTCITSRLQICP